MKPNPRKGRAGRKSKWATHIQPKLSVIKYWRRMGICVYEKDVAKKLGIHVSTLEVYKAQHPELKEALKEGKEELLADLVDAGVKRAKGYEIEKIIKTIILDKDGKQTGKMQIQKTIEHFPPHPTCFVYLTKNLAPELLSDVQDFRHQGRIDAHVTQESVTPEMLKEFQTLLTLEIQKRLSVKDVSPDGNGDGNGSKNRMATLVKVP